MERKERWALVRAFSHEYQRATKKEKTILLTQLAAMTAYSRKHLMDTLPNPPHRPRVRRNRPSRYLPAFPILKTLWAISNYACGQRLVPMIPVYLTALMRHEHWRLRKHEKELLTHVSAATADRLLAHERRRISLKGRSRTKPGSLLKHQIPIRTFADWNEKTPGFLEIDSVHHGGDSAGGVYAWSLDATDVSTGWNECAGHLGRGEYETLAAMGEIRRRLPFPLKGVDFDTGGEFVNWHFLRWCTREKITYTRAREGKKNDQNYVEQQNYSVVRRFVGYARIEEPWQVRLLNRLYEKLSDYQNFFQPVMRLKEKVRHGTRLTRRYDKPKTAYQRVREDPTIEHAVKECLRRRFRRLNPKKLLMEITTLGRKLTQRRR
ncbi:hypothetical protein HY087_02865 [Candidatus Gottesmanbacteria bacterium]|nr:hypothetical protein [Candidatus Gottesmanbacteria bacterium]